METGVKVSDVMRKSVVTVKLDDSCDKAMRYMVDLDIGSVIVSENHKALGILTDSNLLERVFYNDLDPKMVKIEKVMTQPLRTIAPEADIEAALRAMRDLNIKRLPVLKNEKLVGILTEADIMSVSPALFEIIAERTAMRCSLPETESSSISGICESCGTYSEELVSRQGNLVCPECR